LTRTILFVCVGNAGRSQMAEAIFNKLRPAEFHAISAGTRPASSVNPLVIEALRQIGIDISNSKPKVLTPDMITQAERIITMGCETAEFCPAKFLPKIEEWRIEDPKGKSLEGIVSIREVIRGRVQELVQQLQSS